MNSKTEKKNLFEYDNYREFLRDTYLLKKKENKNFSFRVFSRMAGFKAGNYLKLVMDGERNLSADSSEKFADALKLNKEETDFFKNLVLFNQATSSTEKGKYAELLLCSRTYRKIHPLKEIQYRYFGQWYFVPIREMVNLPEFREDPAWIAKRLSPVIEPSEAKRALEELQTIGLLFRDEQGHLRQANPAIGTSDEVTSSALAQCHREMMKRAAESIDRFPRQKRELNTLTFSISSEAAKKLKDVIENFRKEVVEVVTQDTQKPDCVQQLSVYLFPLVDTQGEGEKNK